MEKKLRKKLKDSEGKNGAVNFFLNLYNSESQVSNVSN